MLRSCTEDQIIKDAESAGLVPKNLAHWASPAAFSAAGKFEAALAPAGQEGWMRGQEQSRVATLFRADGREARAG